MARANLYQTLGVPRTASESEIRKAYRRIARENHPDRNPGDRDAEDRFKEASYAKEVLLNKGKRALYDEFGEVGLRDGFQVEQHRRRNADRHGARRPGPGSAGPGPEDIFEHLRRSAGSAGQASNGASRPGKGPGNWSGSFQDFIHGDVVDSIFGRNRGPKGKRDLVSDINVTFLEAVQGTEKEISFRVPGGGGERVLRARIPPGVTDGGRVRLRGQGTDGGDLVLVVKVGDHAFFARDGLDLLLTLPVTIGEAFHGTKIPVPTPTGEVQLSLPAGVKSGAKLRLRGRGVRRGEERGDLIATVQIQVPEATGKRAAELVDELEQTYHRDPRSELKL